MAEGEVSAFSLLLVLFFALLYCTVLYIFRFLFQVVAEKDEMEVPSDMSMDDQMKLDVAAGLAEPGEIVRGPGAKAREYSLFYSMRK